MNRTLTATRRRSSLWHRGRLNRTHGIGKCYAYKTPILDTINSIFESLDARGTVSTATLDNTLFRTGETDGTDDIAGMARTDNVWSQCSIYAVGGLIRDFVEGGRELGTIDIHFDPKSLKSDHSEALNKAFRELVVRMAKQYAYERSSRLLEKLTIRHIEPVTKPEINGTPDKFQMGTWVAKDSE